MPGVLPRPEIVAGIPCPVIGGLTPAMFGTVTAMGINVLYRAP